jgi:PAS domain S-box-containing protein
MNSAVWKSFVDGLPSESRLSRVLIDDWVIGDQPGGQKREATTPLTVRSISPKELNDRLEAASDLLAVAIPHLAWMSAALSNIPHVVFLVDQNGIVLHSTGNDTKRMADFALFPGYDWSEESMGRNGGGSALAHNRPVAVVGREHDSPLDDCTCTGAPLHAPDGTVLGAIAINTRVSHGTPERLVLVAHTAYVINQELLHSRERRADKFQLLQHTTIRILAETHGLADAGGRILQTVASTLGLKWGAIWIIDHALNVLRCVEIWHETQPWFNDFDTVSRQLQLTHGEGLPGRAWAMGGPMWSTKLVNDLHPRRATVAVNAGFSGGFAFPIRNGIVTLGVIEFFDGAAVTPDPEFFRVMDTIGSQLGLFIQRREAESALRATKLQYATLAESLTGILFSTTAEGSSGYHSPQLEEYCGLPPGAAEGEGWLQVIHPDDQQAVTDRWQQAKTSVRPFITEYRIRDRDGAYRWFAARAVAAKDADGNVVSWSGNAIDIDQQKRAEEALRVAEQRKDEFLGMLAHELRNPLAPIRNSLQLLAMQPDAETAKSAQEIAERQFKQMSRLIEDLLDVSRINRGKVALHLESVDFRDIVSRSAEVHESLFAKSGQILDILLPQEPLMVHGDPLRLEQLVNNLLNNASKFTPPGGRVQVGLEQASGQGAVLTVEDNGHGVAPELLPYVFDMFVQGEMPLDRAAGGLGVGLTVVKRLVEMHGGAVTVHSDGVGRGTRIVVRLPIDLPRPEAADTGKVEPPAVASRPLRVLIVDDNKDAAMSLALAMNRLKHRVEIVHDGNQALIMAKSFRPEVIFLDIGLPGKDGYQVARALRAGEAGDRLTIVAITGYGSSDDRTRSREAGFDHHLVKPASLSTLVEILSSHARFYQ